MKKALVGMAIIAASLCAVADPAVAFSPNPNPGYLHNCVGRTTSYVTQGNDISPFNSATGIGNVATANDSSATNVIDYIKFVACS
jgi:hypothetical protein